MPSCRTYNPVIDVLLLCTANQCRSPVAEVLLRQRLRRAGVDATVTSAGFLPGGRPATDFAVAVAAARGLDLSQHRSQQVTPTLLSGPDLVLTMTREHVREIVLLDPQVIERTFTVKELASLGSRLGPRADHEDLRSWVHRAALARSADDLIGDGHDDRLDVADPVGGTRAQYDATAALLDDVLGRIFDLTHPSQSRGGGQTQEQRA